MAGKAKYPGTVKMKVAQMYTGKPSAPDTVTKERGTGLLKDGEFKKSPIKSTFPDHKGGSGRRVADKGAKGKGS